MDRRTFLKSGLGSLGVGLGTYGLSGQYNTTYSVEFKLYQTQGLSAELTKNKYKDWMFDIAENIIKTTLNRDFPELEVTVIRGPQDVPSGIVNPNDRKSEFDKSKILLDWIQSNEHQTPAEHGNLLFGMNDFITNSVDGISNTSLLPSCCSPINQYSVIWYNSYIPNKQFNMECITLHELGHCLGLKHYHGSIIENEEILVRPPLNDSDSMFRSVMLPHYYDPSFEINIYGESISRQLQLERIPQFNGQIPITTLRI